MAAPFTKNESIVVLATRKGEIVRKAATVRKVQTDGKILVKFDDGTERLVPAEKCQHKRGRKAGSTVTAKTTEKPAARTPRNNSDKKQTTGRVGRPRKVDAAPTTEKKVNNLPNGKKHTDVMGAVGGGNGEGRMANFMENPCAETAQEIADAVFANLMALTKGKRGAKKATAKATAAPKAKRNSRKIVANDDDEDEIEAPVKAKRGRKPTAKNAKAKPTVRVKAGSRRPMSDHASL